MKRHVFFGFIPLIAVSIQLEAAEKYALLIGINQYQSELIQSLKYSEPDAGYLRDVLINDAQYKPQNIRTLLGKDATFTAIKSGIFWLGKTAGPNDDVFFYFSGHGTRVPDESANEGMDGAFCPYETNIADPASVILVNEFGYWFERVKSRKVIVILDCCYSGGAAGRGLEQEGIKGLEMAVSSQAKALPELDKVPFANGLAPQNKFIMTACNAIEQSYENPKLGHGIFTYYVGEAIRGLADASQDKTVDVNELYNYTKTKTLDFARSISRTQTPMRFGLLDSMTVSRLSKRLCNLLQYDEDYKTVRLELPGNLTRRGDTYIIHKKTEDFSRDLEIADMPLMAIRIDTTFSKYCEGTIIEEYVPNAKITETSLREYYAEKLCSGSLFVLTEPWSTVMLDGKEIGPTPVTVMKVPEGSHSLEFRIQADGYPPMVKKDIEIQEDQKVRIVEKFQKVK